MIYNVTLGCTYKLNIVNLLNPANPQTHTYGRKNTIRELHNIWVYCVCIYAYIKNCVAISLNTDLEWVAMTSWKSFFLCEKRAFIIWCVPGNDVEILFILKSMMPIAYIAK